MLFIELDEVRLLATITDKYLKDTERSYENHLEEILVDHPVPEEALTAFFVDLLLAPPDIVEESVERFLDLPITEMPGYTIPRPISQKRPTSLCPPPEEGTYLWQMLLAKWRLQLQK
jgi:hypothetical protein